MPLRRLLICLVLLCIGPGLAGCGSRTGPFRGRKWDGAGPIPDAGVRPRPEWGVLLDASRPDPPLSAVDEVVRACALALSCAPQHDGFPALTISSCIDQFGGLTQPVGGYMFGPHQAMAKQLIECAQVASGTKDRCWAFRSCYGGNWVGLNLCREGAQCKGSQLVWGMSPPEDLTFDCAKLGWGCVDLPTGMVRACCTGSCPGTQPSCSGTRGIRCEMGVYFEYDCAPGGGVCSTSAEALCVGTGASCAPSTPVTCAGATATFCLGGKTAQASCALNPFRSACTGTYVVCGPAGKECGPEFQGACTPSGALTVCVDGRKRELDCHSIGFEICYPPNAGRSARCGFLL